MNYCERIKSLNDVSKKYHDEEMNTLEMIKARWNAVPWADDMTTLQESISKGIGVVDAYNTLLADMEILRSIANIAKGIDRLTQFADVNKIAIGFEAAMMRCESVIKDYKMRCESVIKDYKIGKGKTYAATTHKEGMNQ